MTRTRNCVVILILSMTFESGYLTSFPCHIKFMGIHGDTYSWGYMKIISRAGGGAMSDIKDLKKKLFDGYDRQIRPVFNQSAPINMNMSFVLSAIDYLELKSQKLKWNGFVSLVWYDQTLSWNSSEYGDTEYITLPQSDVWLPDFVIRNDVSSSRTLGSPDTLIFLRSSGRITWEPAIVTETSCKIDIRKYPFDVQKCKFEFLPWMTTKKGLNTTSVLDKIVLTEFIPHGEFTVTGSSMETVYIPMTFVNDSLLGITFTIELTRRPTFYWLIMIFPMMTFPMLCPISFLVPVECGEKITLSITVVLSFLVFIGSMNDAMPKLSDTVSLLVVYSSVQTTVSMLTVVANGIIICVSKLPADFTFKLPLFAFPRPVAVYKKTNSLQTIFQNINNVSMIRDEYSKKEEMKESEETSVSKRTENNNWILTARKMDKICFVLFMALTVLVSIIFAFLIFWS